MKSLLQRYLEGECTAVYKEIELLDVDKISEQQQNEIHQILDETFRRVRYNLDVIYTELQAIGYIFETDEPLHEAYAGTTNILSKINHTITSFGKLPLSLRYFYKYTGGVNFVGNYDDEIPILWEMSDVIQIISLPELLEIVDTADWQEEMDEIYEDEQIAYLELSADVYHKDNISGGRAYAIRIQKESLVDTSFLFEMHDTSFVNYLRICFEYAGFPGVENFGSNASFNDYLLKVKPLLKTI